MNALAQLRSRFSKTLAELTPDPATFAAMVKPTQDAKFGDLQANFAMPLAKQLGKNPRELAAEIVDKLDVSDLCQPPEVAGPGFINIRLRDDWLTEQTNRNVADSRLGIEPVAKPKRIVIDYSAPNVAKPMHVGHLRSTVLGNALYRVAKFLGHHVLGDNHIGDWGTQFGMILFGYKNFLDRAAFEAAPVMELARQYRLVSQLSGYHDAKAKLPIAMNAKLELVIELANLKKDLTQNPDPAAKKMLTKEVARKEARDNEAREYFAALKKQIEAIESSSSLKALADAHPQIAELARLETAKLHAGDEENTRLWNLFVPQCLAAIQGIYDRLDIRFDMTCGESFYNPMLADVVAEFHAKGLAAESDGAICVFIPGNAAPFIIRKRDGAFTYATSDLATIRYRVNELQADTMLYVVDTRQSEHFRLLFETAKLWGYGDRELVHVNFGTILGKDNKPYKTRSGDTVGLESLLDAAVAKARQTVNENDDGKPEGRELSDTARATVAETVGIGAIKYADLRHNRESDYVYDEDKMLATNGDTATYMQYAYARVAGIFRRGGIDRETLRSGGGQVVFTHPSERALSLQLLRFSEALDAVLAENRPNILTDYLFATANSFSTFYQECSVLKEPDAAIRTSRLLLCDLTARVIATGLDLLGIRTCEQM